MPNPAEPQPDPEHAAPEPAPAASLSVAVERTGGFAGLTRRWGVTATVDDGDRWRILVDACPWPRQAGREPAPTPASIQGADRFCWVLTADADDEQRRVALDEHEVDGPWRTLIDAVREAATATPPGERPAAPRIGRDPKSTPEQ